jgi:hypothetical protein
MAALGQKRTWAVRPHKRHYGTPRDVRFVPKAVIERRTKKGCLVVVSLSCGRSTMYWAPFQEMGHPGFEKEPRGEIGRSEIQISLTKKVGL